MKSTELRSMRCKPYVYQAARARCGPGMIPSDVCFVRRFVVSQTTPGMEGVIVCHRETGICAGVSTRKQMSSARLLLYHASMLSRVLRLPRAASSMRSRKHVSLPVRSSSWVFSEPIERM